MDEMNSIPQLPVPDLSKLGDAPPQFFDPKSLPDALHVEFTLIDYSFFVDEIAGGGTRARIEFVIPMLPFIKFSIPWGLDGIRDLADKANRTLGIMEARENAATPEAAPEAAPETEPPPAA